MRRTLAFLVAVALVLLASCRQTTRPVPIPPEPPPAANSPENAVRLLEWCWNHRNYDALVPLFTEDYVFVFALGDSAGNPYRSSPFTREDELACARAIFLGTDDHAPASDIQLDLDKTLIALYDDRPGKNPKWHKTIRTKVNLVVTLDRGSGPEVNEVNGYAKFYLVRGDSAAIPADLVARGFQPDSTRWWIDRWEDETLPPGSSRAQPTQNGSWGRIKVLFR